MSKVTLEFEAEFVESVRGNYFKGLPDEIDNIVGRKEGLVRGIVDNLFPDRRYSISITIKEVE